MNLPCRPELSYTHSLHIAQGRLHRIGSVDRCVACSNKFQSYILDRVAKGQDLDEAYQEWLGTQLPEQEAIHQAALQAQSSYRIRR